DGGCATAVVVDRGPRHMGRGRRSVAEGRSERVGFRLVAAAAVVLQQRLLAWSSRTGWSARPGGPPVGSSGTARNAWGTLLLLCPGEFPSQGEQDRKSVV